MCVVIRFPSTLSVMARASFSFTNSTWPMEHLHMSYLLLPIPTLLLFWKTEKNWTAGPMCYALYFHGDKIMTSQFVHSMNRNALSAKSPPSVNEADWVTDIALLVMSITSKYHQLPGWNTIGQLPSASLFAFATRSFTLSSSMFKPFWLVYIYILLSLILDHFGSREREDYRITFCDSLVYVVNFAPQKESGEEPLWNMSAVRSSCHHNPEDQNKQHVFACLWYQQDANDEKGSLNKTWSNISYNHIKVGHLGHIYVQVRARVSLQRTIKQLLTNQPLFWESYVTSCTCSTSNRKHDMSSSEQKRGPLVQQTTWFSTGGILSPIVTIKEFCMFLPATTAERKRAVGSGGNSFQPVLSEYISTLLWACHPPLQIIGSEHGHLQDVATTVHPTFPNRSTWYVLCNLTSHARNEIIICCNNINNRK